MHYHSKKMNDNQEGRMCLTTKINTKLLKIIKYILWDYLKILYLNSWWVFFLGTVGSEESWRYCVMDTNRVLGFALGAMFVEEAFQGDSKKKVSWHFVNLKQSILQEIFKYWCFSVDLFLFSDYGNCFDQIWLMFQIRINDLVLSFFFYK